MNPLWSSTSRSGTAEVSSELSPELSNGQRVPARRPATRPATAQESFLGCGGRARVRMPIVVWALVAAISLIFAARGIADTSQVVESRGLVNTTRAQLGLRALSPQAALD